MLLLPDGTVMAHNNGGNAWYRLTPDSQGHYIHGTWTTLTPMHDTRLYFSSDVLIDGRVFIAGGELGQRVVAYTSQMRTPSAREATLSSRAGMNSWPTKPV